MLRKLLVANRGEVAVRIIRSCRELGIPSVAVFSEADRDALHVKMADEAVCIGAAEAASSYLNIGRIIQAAIDTNVDSIHPGWGFLSENPDFAFTVEENGMKFIGPDPKTVALMGDKTRARAEAISRGLPVIPGFDGKVHKASEARKIAKSLGYPIMIKAAAGGGGRGIRIVSSPETIVDQVKSAIAEARSCFGNGDIFMEKMISPAKHVEVQVFGDGKGGAIHLGERDCSVQRRHQKLIEETPCRTLNDKVRKKILGAAVKLASALKYRGAGTVEFLLDEKGHFWFMEMNTRLQVEHPVTESVFGVDIVRMQLELAGGTLKPLKQNDFSSRGCAIEARVNAEDDRLMPAVGRIDNITLPGGQGVRIDTACYSGYDIPPQYDSMIGKVIVWAPDRSSAIRKLDSALREMSIDGLPTSIPFIRQILLTPEFLNGQYATTLLEAMKAPEISDRSGDRVAAAIFAALLKSRNEKPHRTTMVSKVLNRWGIAARHQTFSYRRGF